MSFNGQASSEMLVAVAIILVLFVLVLVNNSLMTNSSNIVADYSKEKTNCTTFAYSLSEIFVNGPGTESFVEIDKNVIIYPNTKTIKFGETECTFLAKMSYAELSPGKIILKNIDGNVTVTNE